MSEFTTWDVLAEWRNEFGHMWERDGLYPSAEAYADIVAQQRLGVRKSLSYRYDIVGGRRERSVRDQIRAQVDVCIREVGGER